MKNYIFERPIPEDFLKQKGFGCVSSCWIGNRLFYEHQSVRCFFDFEISFQNCFWILFSTSGLSETCEIRNVWKLPSPEALSSSEKISLSLKTSFWVNNCPKNSKMAMKIFQVCKGFHSFGISCLDILKA
jgi:hypothetical protein